MKAKMDSFLRKWGFGFLLLLSFSLSAEEPDPIVAKVNNHEIPLSYIYQKIEALPLGDQIDVREEVDRYIDSLIKEEMLFQFILVTDFQEEPELREKIKTQVVEYLIGKYVRSQINISEELIRKYYDKNNSQIRGEHLRIRYILLNNQESCQKVKEKIDQESAFAKMAQSHSLDQSSSGRGGDLGYIMKNFNVLGFESRLFSLPLHQVHQFENDQGCHLVWISEHIKPPLPPLLEVKENIKQILESELEVELLQRLLEKSKNFSSVQKVKTKEPK